VLEWNLISKELNIEMCKRKNEKLSILMPSPWKIMKHEYQKEQKMVWQKQWKKGLLLRENFSASPKANDHRNNLSIWIHFMRGLFSIFYFINVWMLIMEFHIKHRKHIISKTCLSKIYRSGIFICSIK
jgi:hypothetical protein